MISLYHGRCGHHGLRPPDHLAQPLNLKQHVPPSWLHPDPGRSCRNRVHMRRPSQSKRQALVQRLPSKPSTKTAELVFVRIFFRSIPLGAPCASKRWRSTNRRAHCVPTTTTQQTCSAKGVVSEAYNEAFPGCTSDWSKVGNLIDSQDAMAQVGANSNMQNRTVFPYQDGIKGLPPPGASLV